MSIYFKLSYHTYVNALNISITLITSNAQSMEINIFFSKFQIILILIHKCLNYVEAIEICIKSLFFLSYKKNPCFFIRSFV